jgi:hypothetical protein
MYLVAHAAALVVGIALLALGVVTGLAMAKWLEWPWFGRQLEAGAKAGAIACVPAGLVALFALLIQGPHDAARLADASHLGPISGAGFARAFSFGGWVSADLSVVVLCTAFAVLLAAGTTLVAGWSKSARTVQAVTRAYEAAQALRRGTWGPAPSSQVPAFPSSLAAGPAWQGATSPSIPLVGTAQPAAVATPYTPLALPVPAVATAVSPDVGRGVGRPEPGHTPANTPTNDEELRKAMREALAMWGDDTGETAAVSGTSSNETSPQGTAPASEEVEQPTERRKRTPKASQFLNDGKRKGRKKTDTRDWLC